ncbi:MULTISPECIES: hypothetical protein [Haloarcula]|uniref:hypothetical protein n=1 Tax=Haloarcula TaxID=2237 RepID=UPI0023E7DF85|nr:hypothetical protein [Halomicroarcula sp. SHR3]
MLRRLLTEAIETYLPWLPVGLAMLFGFIVHQPSETFESYKVAHNVSPGPMSWVFWVAAITLFAAGGVAFFYFLLSPSILGAIPNPVYSMVNVLAFDFVGELQKGRPRLMVASGFYLLTTGIYAMVSGSILELERANYIRENSAYFISMFGDSSKVGLEAFSYGILGDPQIEFAVQVLLLVLIATYVMRNYVTLEDFTVFAGLSGIVVLSYFGALFTGTQVFPIDARVAFVVQLFVSFGMLVVLVGAVYLSTWSILKTTLGGTRNSIPERPTKDEYVLGAAILMVALPVFSSPLASVLAWGSVVLSWLEPREVLESNPAPETDVVAGD